MWIGPGCRPRGASGRSPSAPPAVTRSPRPTRNRALVGRRRGPTAGRAISPLEGTAVPTMTKKKPDGLPIGDRTMAGLTQVFKLLADDSRLRILLTLAREGETHVSALCAMLG